MALDLEDLDWPISATPLTVPLTRGKGGGAWQGTRFLNVRARQGEMRLGSLGRGILAGLIVVALAACESGPTEPFLVENPIPSEPYDYPVENPLAATVVGTPAEFRPKLPKDYPTRIFPLTVFPDRQVPEVFWYHERLRISFAAQEEPAPLVFSIGGTGADVDSAKMQFLERLLWASGYHVISVASPTHPSFVVAGSETSVPGRVSVDVRDLYRVMQMAFARVADDIEVTDVFLTGYSLGGWHAAFLAHHDQEEARLGFSKVLLVNPPESLFESISILDNMLAESLPGGAPEIRDFFDEAFNAFSQIYKETEFVDFTDDFLYRAYERLEPTDDRLKALIGLAFRLTASSMTFTADVMNGGGYIIPKGTQLNTATSLTPFFRVSTRAGFLDYLDYFYAPFYIARDPDLDYPALVAEASLKEIASYLRDSGEVGLIHNQDDPILGPGDIGFFEETFQDRALILPTGGHLGNLEHRFVAAAISDFFRD